MLASAVPAVLATLVGREFSGKVFQLSSVVGGFGETGYSGI